MNGNLCLASIDSLYGNTVLMPKQFNRPFVFGEGWCRKYEKNKNNFYIIRSSMI